MCCQSKGKILFQLAFLSIWNFTNYNFLQLWIFSLCLLPNPILCLASVLFCIDTPIHTSNIYYELSLYKTAIIIHFLTNLWKGYKNFLFNIIVTL